LQKDWSFLLQIWREKSIFECMIVGTLSALSFSLQMSTTMAVG